MIIIDKPYISEFFRETIRKNGFPVLKNDFAVQTGLDSTYNLLNEEEVIKYWKQRKILLYICRLKILLDG